MFSVVVLLDSVGLSGRTAIANTLCRNRVFHFERLPAGDCADVYGSGQRRRGKADVAGRPYRKCAAAFHRKVECIPGIVLV